MRRTGIFLAAATVSMAVGAGDSMARERLVVTQWGGVWGTSLDKFVVDAFQKKFDADIVVHRQAAASDVLAKIRAEKQKPSIDVYFAGIDGARALAQEGMAEALPEAELPSLANVYPNLIGKVDGKTYYIGINMRTSGIMVRKDLVKPPQRVTMQWLLDPSLKGQVAIPNLGFGHGLILLAGALANGGSEKNAEPGFEFLKKLAPNVKALYRTSGEASRLLTTGEVAAGYVSSGAVASLLKEGVNAEFYLPADMPAFLGADAVMAVKGGPAGRSLALKFIDFFFEPDKINPYSFGVGSTSPLKNAPPPPKDQVPVAITAEQMTTSFLADGDIADRINAVYDGWNERFNREIVPKIGQ